VCRTGATDQRRRGLQVMPRARRATNIPRVKRRETPQFKYSHEEVQFRGSALATYIAERTRVSTHKSLFGNILNLRTTASAVCATLKIIWREEGRWAPGRPFRIRCDAELYALSNVHILDNYQLALMINRHLQKTPFTERPGREFVKWVEDFPQLSNSSCTPRRVRVTFSGL
jgi:hypothetical protein